jgi:hypothetical protein
MGKFSKDHGKGHGKSKGRGSGGPSSQSSGTKHSSKLSLADCIYSVGTVKQASQYENNTRFLINHIRKTYVEGDLVGDLLEFGREPDFMKMQPALPTSNKKDPAERAEELASLNMLYQVECQEWTQQRKIYKDEVVKAYSLLYEQCNKPMQSKVRGTSGFDTHINKNPKALLDTIRVLSIASQDKRYDYLVVDEAMLNYYFCKQREDENLTDYYDRFVTAKKILKTQNGEKSPFNFEYFATKIDGYNAADPTKVKECQSQALDRYDAIRFLKGADQSKYGSILRNLKEAYSLGRVEYPKTARDALDVLNNHGFDKDYIEVKKKQAAKSKQDDTKPPPAAKDDGEILSLSFAQAFKGRCFICGRSDHRIADCPKKGTPKNKWSINNPKNDKESGAAEDTKASTLEKDAGKGGKVAWQSFQVITPGVEPAISMAQRPNFEDMRDWILLDSQSSVNLFCNPKLVQNITRSRSPLYLGTNAGGTVVQHEAEVPNYQGKVWFDEKAMTNVFSMALMEEKYRITYDSGVESAIIVHTERGPVKFTKGPENLYYFKPKYRTTNEIMSATNFVETVKENELFYTPRQIESAKRAKKLMHSLGCPTVNDLKNILRLNMIADCPVKIPDVVLAEKIYGADLASLKGKTTRSKPASTTQDYVEVPAELLSAQQGIDLCIDMMNVNGLLFLTTVSKRLQYRTAAHVPSKQATEYSKRLMEVIKVYNRADFEVSTVYADNEFRPVIERIQQDFPSMSANFASAKEHVPEAERNNRTIKERVRSCYHALPYRTLTKKMVMILVMESAAKLNWFPPKNGVSQAYSPRMLLHRRKVDYTKHCSIPIFSFVQAHDDPDPKNNQAPRTLDCIYLRLNLNEQGGHLLLHLATNAFITRHKVTVVPITKAVIDRVHSIAKQEGMPDGLKIKSKYGDVLYDYTETAGVVEEIENLENLEPADEAESEDYVNPNDCQDLDDDTVPEQSTHDEPDSDEDLEENNMEEPKNDSDLDLEESDPEESEDTDPEESEDTDPEEPDPEENDKDDEEEGQPHTRRSTRENFGIQKPTYEPSLASGQAYSYATAAASKECTYDTAEARVIVDIMSEIKDRLQISRQKYGEQFAITYSLPKGIKRFGENGVKAVNKEMRQLHDRDSWKPIYKDELSKMEKTRAMESLIFLVEKKDGTIKARHCANGSSQRDYLSREDVSSPTVSTEATLLTAVIEAQEGREVITCDIPNAFVQTEHPARDADGNRTIMKIRGQVVDILCEIDPFYIPYVVEEGRHKILYLHITKAIYGMLVSAMLFYRKLKKDLMGYGFEINPYDPCVANKMVNGHQMTVSWHVDDLKTSHKEAKVLEEFIDWVKLNYGTIGEVKVTRGKIHEYLGMKLDYSIKGAVQIDMRDYVSYMLDEFPDEYLEGAKVASPWNENLFKVRESSPDLDTLKKEIFHHTTAQGIFLCKRGRPDFSPAIAFFSTRVRQPDNDDWQKLVRMMKFLKQTQDDVLTLEADGSNVLEWHADAAFAVHPDFKSHTGATMSMGKGVVTHLSRKQNLNTRSSTEAEVVAADDVVGPMLWTRRFLEAQGYPVRDNVLFQDNKSAMLLESNGRKSAGKRSRHLNIRYFFVTDQKEKGHISIKFCPTDQMRGDYMTKPLHGKKFTQFRREIMNLPLTTAAQLMMMVFTSMHLDKPD